MASEWPRLRSSASESVQLLREVIDDPASTERRLITAYLESKRLLAKALEAYAVDLYYDPALLDGVITRIEDGMKYTHGALPEKYLRVRGFGRVHGLLLSYFSGRIDSEVPADELRILTGDAVHTERRARDLRDLGFTLDTFDRGGVSVYVMRDSLPQISSVIPRLIGKNIRDDKSLSAAEQNHLIELIKA